MQNNILAGTSNPNIFVRYSIKLGIATATINNIPTYYPKS